MSKSFFKIDFREKVLIKYILNIFFSKDGKNYAIL